MRLLRNISRVLFVNILILIICSCVDSMDLPESSPTLGPDRFITETVNFTETNVAQVSTPTIGVLPTQIFTPIHTPGPSATSINNSTKWRIVGDSQLANQIWVLLLDPEKNYLWAGGPDGLVEWDLSTSNHVNYRFSTEENKSRVTSLVLTPQKDLWIGTFGNGISLLDKDRVWHTYTQKDGLPSSYITSVFTGKDDFIWVDTSPFARDLPTNAGGFFGQFDGSHWTRLKGGGFYQMTQAQEDVFWAISFPPMDSYWDAIGYYNDGEWQSINIANYPITITAITSAPTGDVWVAAKTGVYHFDGNDWHWIRPPWIDNPHANVSAIEVATDGKVWFGFSFASGIIGGDCGIREVGVEEIGVYHYDDEKWTHFDEGDGLVDNKICDITSSTDGSVIFGSYDEGISLFDGQKWTSYRISNN